MKPEELVLLEAQLLSDLAIVQERLREIEMAVLHRSVDNLELTRRQREILGWLVTGRGNKEIASELHICERTVKFHVSNMLQKAGAHTRVELIHKLRRLTYETPLFADRAALPDHPRGPDRPRADRTRPGPEPHRGA